LCSFHAFPSQAHNSLLEKMQEKIHSFINSTLTFKSIFLTGDDDDDPRLTTLLLSSAQNYIP
jgi:hypothetical protein